MSPSWLVALLAVAEGRPVTLRHPPLLRAVTQTSAQIAFTLEDDAKVKVTLLKGGKATVSATRWPAAYTNLERDLVRYEASITGLKGGQTYSYDVNANGKVIAGPITFHTAPASVDADVDAIVFGDSGVGSDEQRSVAEWMKKQPAELVLHTGDIAYQHGSFKEIEKNVIAFYGDWLNARPFFPTPGNHDYDTQAALPYLAMFTHERFYAFSWGAARFYALDTNAPLDVGDAMARWLAIDAAKAPERFKIAYFHHSPFSTSAHGDDARVIAKLVPLFEQLGFDLVLTGHDHSYERTVPLMHGEPAASGITYIVTGGGGAHLYERQRISPRTAVFTSKHHALSLHIAHGCALRVKAIEPDDHELDHWVLDKCEK